MISRVERKLNIEEIQANVKAYEDEKAKEHIAQIEKKLLEINDFLEKVQEEIVNLSKKGEVKFTFPRYEDGVNRSYVEEIKYFFEGMGFDVQVTTNFVREQFSSDIFWGLGSFSISKAIKYMITVSWETKEEE